MIYLIGSSIIKNWKFPLECQNLGIGGLITSELKQLKVDYNDSIVFYCGGNDIRKYVPIEVIFENIVKFFKNIKSRDVYIISIVKCKKIYDMDRSKQTDILNNMLKDFCKLKGYKYIDSNLIFSYCPSNVECSICKSDGIHLEEVGYKRLEELFTLTEEY